MEVLLAGTVGLLFACGLYMLLRRSLFKVVIGLVLLAHSANLLIFTAAGIKEGAPPLVPESMAAPPAGSADPLPQALILTAIVISFGLTAFQLVLFQRTYAELGTDDLDKMRSTET